MSQEPTYQTQTILVAGQPVPVWHFIAEAGFQRTKLESVMLETIDKNLSVNLLISCRGVGADRLPVILATGCDVEPTDAPLFVADLEKALEYGDEGDQVIQVFHHNCLEPSFREREASLSAEERMEIEKDYPNVIPSNDGSYLFFTRLSPDDNRSATDYERAYGYWIPGNSVEALSALILISADSSRFAEYLPDQSLPSLDA